MKIIFKIAKNELRNLFYSPVAWFIAIIFFLLCALPFTLSLHSYANTQDLLLKNNPKFKDFGNSLTASIYLAPGNIFSMVVQNIYLFIPLLTMNIISREINNGTIKLLYSSPVTLRQIVLGKYLALMIYNLLLIGILGLFIITGIFTIRSVDIGLLLSALMGFYLLICALSAIGFFMSSLSTYQVVSGIATFIVIFILSRVGALWQQYDFIRDLTWFLSIIGRTEKMAGGLITTKDVIYFLVVIYMFVAFTLLKLKGGKESKPWYVPVTRYVAVLLSSLVVGYVSSRPALIGYWDTTSHKTNTILPKVQKILNEMDDNAPLEVTFYTNLLGTTTSLGLPQNRNTYLSALWEPYVRFKPDIKFNYIYYYDNDGRVDSTLYKTFPGKTEKQIAGILADAYETNLKRWITPDSIHENIDLATEKMQPVMQLKYKGRKTFLRTYPIGSPWPEQPQISGAIRRLVNKKVPKVYFLTGDLERNINKNGDREYMTFSTAQINRNSLINLGFDVGTLSLEKQNIPSDITALVVADPKTDLGAATLHKIQQYIDSGGNLLVFGEPGKQQVINPLLSKFGVQLMKGTLVELSRDETPDKVTPYLTDAGLNLAGDDKFLNIKENKRRKLANDSIMLTMPGVTAISYDEKAPYTVSSLLTTIAQHKSWLKAGHLVTDSIAPVFTPLEGDKKEHSFSTAIKLTRQVNHKQQRIIVCADADFASNIRQSDFYAQPVVIAFFSWLNYGEYPVYAPYPTPDDTLLTIKPVTANILRITYVWVLPSITLLLGATLLIRRKRK